MDESFQALADLEEPGREHLGLFVEAVMRLLGYILQDPENNALWKRNRALHQMAVVTYQNDLVPAAERLYAAIGEIPDQQLINHGLVGPAARFKLNVIGTAFRRWRRTPNHFTIRRGFRNVIGAVDSPLESLIAVTGGIGGVIKEFKDSVVVLAPE